MLRNNADAHFSSLDYLLVSLLSLAERLQGRQGTLMLG